MKYIFKAVLVLLSSAVLWSCNSAPEGESAEHSGDPRTTVEMVTNKGTLTIELYNETPKHRDNFVKLVNDGTYDSLIFHRVISGFMIQGGDINSKDAPPTAQLGNGDFPYKIDAEFDTTLFHKKGALAAARDGNMERASSSSQFYIVQGNILNDMQLSQSEGQINNWLAQHFFKLDPANKSLVDSLDQAIAQRNQQLFMKYDGMIKEQARAYENFERYTIPQSHREVYKEIGGTPALDQNYTVFGEVINGLAVVDSIANVQTGMGDRPVEDVRILSVKVL